MEDIIDNPAEDQKSNYNFKPGTVLVWVGIIVFAGVFFFFNWPGQSIILLIGTGGLMAYSVSGMIALKGTVLLNTILFVAGLLFTLYLTWGALFNGGYPYNLIGLIVYFIIVALFLIIYELVRFFKRKRRN